MTISKCGRLAAASVFVASLLLPISSMAQDEEPAGPKYLQVRVVHTQANGAEKWVELQAEQKAALDEEGPQRDVWEEVRGDLDTFHIVSFHDELGTFDEQGVGGPPLGDAQAAWVDAIRPTIASRTQTIMRMHNDLSIPTPEGHEPNLVVLRYFTLRQGQGDAFHAWVADKLKPALEAGGDTGVYLAHMAQGGNAATCVLAGHVENWAEFDGPGSFAHLSEEEQDELFADWGSMVARHETRTLQYRADLSY